ncbi:MAG: phosphorylase [Steroidobacteraceae bacterium]
MSAAGVVAALAAEARALGPAVRGRGPAVLDGGMRVTVSGIGCAAAGRAARDLIEAGAKALVSWGMAGALDPTLAAGTVCLPDEIIASDGTRFATARQWREPLAALVAADTPVAGGKLLTSAHAIETVVAKDLAYRATGAAAVDMESAAVAQAAAIHGLPFIAVRVIVDTAGDAVPRAVVAASRAGQVQNWRLIWGLLISPADIAPLIRLARRYRVAIRSLEAVARVLTAPGVVAASGA